MDELFVHTALRDICDAEKQNTRALPRMTDKASDWYLKQHSKKHLPHDEITRSGTFITWAQERGHNDCADVMKRNL